MPPNFLPYIVTAIAHVVVIVANNASCGNDPLCTGLGTGAWMIVPVPLSFLFLYLTPSSFKLLVACVFVVLCGLFAWRIYRSNKDKQGGNGRMPPNPGVA